MLPRCLLGEVDYLSGYGRHVLSPITRRAYAVQCSQWILGLFGSDDVLSIPAPVLVSELVVGRHWLSIFVNSWLHEPLAGRRRFRLKCCVFHGRCRETVLSTVQGIRINSHSQLFGTLFLLEHFRPDLFCSFM